MFGLMAKYRKQLRLPLDMCLRLFDSSVKAIMLYGCEICSYSNNASIGREIATEVP